MGGGATPAFCRSRTGQFAAMSAAKCRKFSTCSGHNFCPVTYYGMVIKRWNIAESNHRVDIHTYYEATDTFRGLFFKIWAKSIFSFLKMQVRQILILTSDKLENSMRMTAMARFIFNLWSIMNPNWLTLRDTSKKQIFWTRPSGPRIKKTSNLS